VIVFALRDIARLGLVLLGLVGGVERQQTPRRAGSCVSIR
jgi:hypothetical protein